MAVFKSYDIRGIYPEQIDETLAGKIGRSMGRYFSGLKREDGKKSERKTVVVGRDMRNAAPSVTKALIDGLTAAGCDVVDIGMVTTPCVYFAVQRLGADAGVCCTASHNPPKYVGFKVTRELAIPVSYDTGLNEVERRLDEPLATDIQPGAVTEKSLDEEYVDFVAGLAASDMKPLKVAADASNGMAGKYLEDLFAKLPATLEGLYLEPDGNFPNHEADPLKAENLKDVQKLVQAGGADIGLCFDGDADRVAVVDEKGQAVGCDIVTALIAADLCKAHPGKDVMYDLRSSKVVAEVVKQAGGNPVRSRVGHSHVKQAMRKADALFGGELSGHYYSRLKDKGVFYADSALVGVVRLLNMLSRTDKTVSELVAPLMKYHHSGEVNFSVDDKDAALAAIAETFSDGKQDELDGVTVTYPDWWVNVRPSNTEPLLRLTLEGDTEEKKKAAYDRVVAVLQQFGDVASSSH